jgi:hypothetical protein
MSVEKLLHEPKRRLSIQAVFETVEEGDACDSLADIHNTGSSLTWLDTTPDGGSKLGGGDHMEREGQSGSDSDTPDFVLARGNITPDNLLPEVDEEEQGGPGGPMKASSCYSITRSGELSTFDERLHQVRETESDDMKHPQAFVATLQPLHRVGQ